MATLTIDGQKVTVDDSFKSLSPENQAKTVDEIAAQMKAQRGTLAPDTGTGAFGAATEGAHAGLMFGFDDEITAGALAPIDALIEWAQGKGFDLGDAYRRKQKMLGDRKKQRREDHPIASTVGEVTGGLAAGGKAAQSGLTLAGRMATPARSVAAAGAEGAGYGALYGAGEAEPGERAVGAAAGGLIGGFTGAGAQLAGNTVASWFANRGAKKVAASSQAMKEAAGDMFDASEASGVRFTPKAVQTLGKRLKVAAGKINDKLRPTTAGYADEIDQIFNGEMPLEAFEEFRQVLGAEIKKAKPNDQRTLGMMKRVLDSFADNAKAGDFVGDAAGIDVLRNAREMWARAKKTELIEKIIDNADRKGTGRYSQAGFASAARGEMEKLYTAIQNGRVKGFTPEETSLVRQIAAGGSNSKVIGLLARFAPRGPVSITLGQILGGLFPGGNIAVPIAGSAAGAARDRAAEAALEALIESARSGAAPQASKVVTKKAAPFIGGAAAGATEAVRILSTPQ